MTALTADRHTASRAGDRLAFDVAASVKCYAGALAVLDNSGDVKPGVTATGLIPVGRFAETVDNSTGTAGLKMKLPKFTLSIIPRNGNNPPT